MHGDVQGGCSRSSMVYLLALGLPYLLAVLVSPMQGYAGLCSFPLQLFGLLTLSLCIEMPQQVVFILCRCANQMQADHGCEGTLPLRSMLGV